MRGALWAPRHREIVDVKLKGCCGGVRTLGNREDVGSVRTLRDREDVGSVGMLGDREASEVFIPLGEGCPGIAGWS